MEGIDGNVGWGRRIRRVSGVWSKWDTRDEVVDVGGTYSDWVRSVYGGLMWFLGDVRSDCRSSPCTSRVHDEERRHPMPLLSLYQGIRVVLKFK